MTKSESKACERASCSFRFLERDIGGFQETRAQLLRIAVEHDERAYQVTIRRKDFDQHENDAVSFSVEGLSVHEITAALLAIVEAKLAKARVDIENLKLENND